jgi:hypothetical protein
LDRKKKKLKYNIYKRVDISYLKKKATPSIISTRKREEKREKNIIILYY